MPEKRRSTKMLFGIYWTNLGPTSVDLNFYAPNVANLGFWKIELTIALQYRQLHYSTDKMQVRGLTGGAFSNCRKKPLEIKRKGTVFFFEEKLNWSGCQFYSHSTSFPAYKQRRFNMGIECHVSHQFLQYFILQ